jgi:glycosyltransferase involved in cell wall biosynthesis
MQNTPPSGVLESKQIVHHEHNVEAASGPIRRVFFLVDSLQIGGTETQAVELALRLDPARYRVTLGCMLRRGPLLARLENSNVSVIEVRVEGGVDSPNGIYQILRLARYLRRGRFDVVHTHDLWSNLLGIPAGWIARVPVVISSRRDLSHLTWYTPLKRRFLRHLQRLSSAVLVNSRQVQNQLVHEDGFSPELIRVVYNGIDLERFGSIGSDRERLFPGLENCTLIVTTGNMNSDVKGHPTLIEAARAVCSKFPQVRFVLIGDGRRRAEFESKVSELGLKEKFLFLGSRQDVPELLACCDMAVLPSRAEGFSNALLEYFAMGLPTIATQVGGNAEIVQHRANGLLVSPDNPAALAEAIVSLQENPRFASQLGSAGRERVRSHFGFEQLTASVDTLYTDLLNARR